MTGFVTRVLASHPLGRVAVLFTAIAALAGCSSQGLYGVPLPGGVATGDDAYHVTIEFSDVLDLVPQSAVKVNDVTVGTVQKIRLSGWTARVQVSVRDNVKLPDNATAAIRQTSLLGEKFVQLAAPTEGKSSGRLSNGDVIPLSRTKRNAEVEEVLSAFALLLNGGGLPQLRTINAELAKAFTGRESQAKDALHQLDAFIGGLDDQKQDIIAALEALDRLSAQLAEQRTTVANAVDALGPGLRVLSDQRQQLVAMLKALSRLGDVGTRVIEQSRDDLVANLQSLQPILTQLVRAGDNLPKSMDLLLTYPFPPNVTNAIVGDYVNLHVSVDLDVTTILANLLTKPDVQAPPTGDPGKVVTVPPSLTGPTAPVGPDGKPLPPGEANAQQGGLVDLLLGGLAR